MIDLNNQIHVDPLQLYFQRPIIINDRIEITQPTIGQIIDYGEQDFYSMLYKFIGNTTMFRLNLWNNGLDWNKISDYELFSVLVTQCTPQETSILFKGLDFSLFQCVPKITVDQKQVMTLYDLEHQLEIDEEAYTHIVTYLRTMFHFFPKNEFARGKATKEAMIWEDEENLKLRQKEPSRSMLFPLISSCLNHPGFKYKKTELEQIGIFEFMDSVQRLQTYESTTALLKGAYSGFMDTSKINKEEFNFMHDLYSKNQEQKN